MRSPETTATIPDEQNPQYDALVVLGRGIGKDAKGVWRPTSYFSKMAGGLGQLQGFLIIKSILKKLMNWVNLLL